MLSFLQNRLGRRASAKRSDTVRMDSPKSHLSRSSSAINASGVNSETPVLTPPTSNTDAASSCEDMTAKTEKPGRSSDRLRHSRSSIGSYNESVLSGFGKHGPRRKTVDGSSRTVSGDTLVENTSRPEDQLIQESVQALNEGWALGALPGDDLMMSGKEGSSSDRRRSTRLGLVEKAATLVETTSAAWGKRGREAADAGVGKLKALQKNKRPDVRPHEVQSPSFEGPVAKKARFTETPLTKEALSPIIKEQNFVKPPSKRWLSQGLYVGQDCNFDPKLTEAENQSRRKGKAQDGQRPILPLPMFAGQRTLENGRHFKLPYDVFSPLPPGQPKPDEWKKTHKNVFIGDAASEWKKAKPLETSKCICAAETGCDEDCFNRFMLYECDDSNCDLGPGCTNRPFEELRERSKAGGKYHIGVEISKTPDRGYGLRANRTFEPNQIIVEYTGEIITQDECDDRMRKCYKNAECYYLMDFEQGMILDATRGSIARFINHSCEPNCRMIKWTVAGKPRMALFAGDNGIMTGDELTYDYNFDPYSTKNVQECRCGTPSCRGVLGPKPKETRDIKEALAPIATGGKRKFQQALEETVEKVTKKRKIAIPTSVRSTLSKVKARTTGQLTKARALTSSNTQNEGLVKKISERSLRGIRRISPMEQTEIKTTRKTIVAMSKPRSADGTFMKSPVKLDKNADSKDKGLHLNSIRPRVAKGTFTKTPIKTEDSEDEGLNLYSIRPANRKDSVKARASTVKQNVVRTTRRSSRAGNDKTIRVIAGEETEQE